LRRRGLGGEEAASVGAQHLDGHPEGRQARGERLEPKG